MRHLLAGPILFAAVAVSGCATSSPSLASTMMSDSTSSADTSVATSDAAASVYGTWAYTAESGDRVMRGELFLSEDPAEHRLTAPGLVSDEVLNSELVVDGSTVSWSGVLQTQGGPAGFRIASVRTGGMFSGTVDIEGLGTYTLVAIRAQ